ncbi:amino acid permease-domain-containing protein [Podospora aff. communis PSN243]|uniref:Amino acid permease-domain-containing protein n=1 Tax=Podospora aff. communis PSN243 TaxID=3040156 RepID=A0AAV9GQI6_9PEZI|nr:amino acid permease-domain-containing protein [Podospora aff. communis PSN243]
MDRTSIPADEITDAEEAELQTLTPEQVEERIRQHNAETDLSLSPTKKLALTVPIHYIFHEGRWQRLSAPRNGGDKNYLEYVYKRPRDLMKCIFGITFIIWGNLAGNALQFGVFVQRAIHPSCGEAGGCVNRGYVVAWGVAVLTVCALLNVATRKHTMGLNNIFAVMKLAFVAFVVVAGIIYGSLHGDGCRSIAWEPIDRRDTASFGDIALALFFAMYPYTGYEQPFYVLAEASRPRETFPKATMYAMLSVLILFPLANVSYLCMNPYTGNVNLPENMALAFVSRLSGVPQGQEDPVGIRVVSILLAFFIFGNLMAQTYTASRVKQEVAKEGILLWSMFFAKGNDTLFSRIGSSSGRRNNPYRGGGDARAIHDLDGHREQAPFAATGLHWLFEILLLLVFGLTMEPSAAYGGLTYIYTYTIVGILGLLTAAGLLYLKADGWVRGPRGRKWRQKSVWQPWLDPLPVTVATVGLGFMLVAAFAKLSEGKQREWPWWVAPSVGVLASIGLGFLWWCGLQFVQWAGRWKLETQRLPVVEVDELGHAIQKAELVEHIRVPVEGNTGKD